VLFLFITLLITILLSRLFQRHLGIPLPISILALTYLLYSVAPLPHIEPYFDEIVLFLLPLVLLPDVINFKISDLKKFGFAIFYLSFIAVILSIAAGVLLNSVIFGQYQMTIGMLVALFAMVLATDAVSVSSIFSQFKLPHSLKVLTEGESLFNDATAVIAFFFLALPLIEGKTVTPTDISFVLIRVVIVSIFIGFVVGFIAQFVMKFLHESVDEFIIILLTAYLAFAVAELHAIHVSGILALIVSVMTLKFFINKSLVNFEDSTQELTTHEQKLFKTAGLKTITTKTRLDQNKSILTFFAFFANALLFFSLAQLVDFTLMTQYSQEIMVLFIATTLLRGLMMLKFTFISRSTKHIIDINYRWWSVLTFAGIKGGLSIIMVHSLPNSFIYKAMFEQIVIGVILLSIFVYATFLVLIIKNYKQAFEEDSKHEHHDAI